MSVGRWGETKRIGRYFILFLTRTELKSMVVEIKVNHQAKGAVQRNRIKRVIREYFRGWIRNQGQTGIKLVCVARSKAGQAKKHELFEDLSRLYP